MRLTDGLMHHFAVITKYSADYDGTIHEALLIKNNQQKLNKQLYENGSCLLLKLF